MNRRRLLITVLIALASCPGCARPTARHVVPRTYMGPLALLNNREVAMPSAESIDISGEWIWPTHGVLVGDFGDNWTSVQWAGENIFVDELGISRTDCRCLGTAALGAGNKPLMVVWYFCGDYKAGAAFFNGHGFGKRMTAWLRARGVPVPD